MTSELLDRVASDFNLPVAGLDLLLHTYTQNAMQGRNALGDVRRPAKARQGPVKPANPAHSHVTDLYRLTAECRRHAQGGAILDVGCGPGEVLEQFARQGFEAHAIEPNAQLRARAVAALARHGQTPTFHDADLDAAPIPDRLFDVIICNSIIEHARKPHSVIVNLGRMLTTGGVLILGVANGDALGNAIADPHHGRFGLTLLRPDLAASLYRLSAGNARSYDVTGFLPIAHYASLLRAAIGEIRIAPNADPRTIEAVPDLLARLAAGFADAMGPKGLPATSALRPHLKAAFAAYTQRVLAAYRDAVEPEEAEAFREMYIRKFVHIAAIKKAITA